jgi:2-dehydro-3-deoxyphosphogluconate aldolase / (4S)-4-hydroxy-2-oxoglutarate aldolase
VSAGGEPGGLDAVRAGRLVAVARGLPADRADAVAGALLAGGVRAMEVTLDHPDAARAIRLIAARGDIAIGAGTVRRPEQVEIASAAGATFCVSPVLSLEVLERCAALRMPAVPGAFTPTEVEQAWGLGAAMVKLFPAGALGPGYVRDLRAPLPDVPLLCTGGVDAANAPAFLEAGASAVGLGSALLPAGFEPAAVEAAARAAVRAVSHLTSDRRDE